MTFPSKRLAAAVLSGALLLGACASARLEKRLDPKSREFVSKARYTITAEERKAFLSLASEEARAAFVADFWKRRDPTPATEENEYKDAYFRRIEESNRLFSGGGSPGWLQDRGSVYITLGPPDQRITYPRGVTFYGVPTEIWYYGFFSIVFVDERWVDDYRLSPDSAMQITMITQAQRNWNNPLMAMSKDLPEDRVSSLPGLDVRVEHAGAEGARITLVIPYRNIWMKSRGERFEANLEVVMRVRDDAGAEAWTLTKAFPIDISQGRLKEVLAQDFTAEAVAPLGPGAYTLTVTVTNSADGSKASLERTFEI